MAASMSTQPPDIDWLYPDLLSRDGLIYILKQRYIQPGGSDLDSLDKEELVELYNRYILPLPQRKYRNNRRGREMTKKQIILAKKRNIAASDDDDESQPSNKNSMQCPPSKGLVNSFGLPGSRLKPPPSCIDFNRKVVKLSSAKKNSTVPMDTSPTGSSGNGQLATADSSNTPSPNSTLAPSSKLSIGTVSHSESSLGKRTAVEANESDLSEEASPGAKKKKFSKISWP
ncbi:uncharacterized protein LOC101860928 [Aplysia californica]|uniref:Ashwin n=1 Tax=Aplysia californica TaxID=6500 RepID=A0ABM1W129_APLCA|nr:uncharacterized protein LOC101860928 [Aplysia californica]